jgi:excisionase family DNA binding protein
VKRLPPGERLALTVEEAAEQLAVSRSKAYELARAGTIPSVKVGNAIRVPRRALEAWIDEQTRRAG